MAGLRLFFVSGGSPMNRRTIEIPVGRLLFGLSILLVGGALMYIFATSTPLGIMRAGRQTSTPTSELDPDPAGVAHQVAVAINAVDYRDPDGWLATLRPLSTDRGFLMLQTVFVPVSWSLFEQDRRVIQPERVVAEDRGVVAEGPGWQVRLVAITIADESLQPDSFEMRIALAREAGAWKFSSLLSQEEVDALVAQAGGSQ